MSKASVSDERVRTRRSCARRSRSVRDGELQTHTAARAHTSLEDQKKHEKKNMNMIRKKKKMKMKKRIAGCGRST